MGLFFLVTQLQMLAGGLNGAAPPDPSRGRHQFNSGAVPGRVTNVGGRVSPPALVCPAGAGSIFPSIFLRLS